MKKTILAISLSLLVIQKGFSQNGTTEWSLKQAPLMTQWAKEVNPADPLPEYPRPQLVRKDWKNLNGIWEFQSGTAGDKLPSQTKLSDIILVPYPVESAISGVMKHYDRLWYRRNFVVPQQWNGKHIRINFGAVDWESEVFINGRSLGIHKGGYDAFSYDITPYLVKGRQEVIVRVFDPTDAEGFPRGKQTTFPVGIMYTPTSGIWQSVWIEPISGLGIEEIKMVPNIDSSLLKLTVTPLSSGGHTSINVQIREGQSIVSETTCLFNKEQNIPIKNPKLWSPEKPFLYDITVTVKSGGKIIDQVKSYFGMRKITLVEEGGLKRIYLNNKFVYETGVLDQGFWPDGLYTAPTDEALKYDLVHAKSMGFNLIRKHIKVEPQRWYYWADKLGLLVWQDMPSANSYLPENSKPPEIDRPQYKKELEKMISGHWNSPAIIVWVLFNEAQGQHNTESLVSTIRKLDPNRLVNEASGNDFMGFGDIIDRHNYPLPSSPESKSKAMVIGEFGGIGFKYPNHTWAQKAEGYTNAKSDKDLIFLYREYSDMLRDFRDQKGLSASIYTQLTDVETETNGLMTYDRLLKLNEPDLKRLNTFSFAKPVYKPLLPTSEKEPQTWKYTTIQPTGTWKEDSFDDSGWNEGQAGFGKRGLAKTKWDSNDIWLRKTFNPGILSKEQINNLVLRLMFEREIEVYINGKSAFTDHGSRYIYEYRMITQEARDHIKSNAVNTIAIHMRKRSDPFIDLGLYLGISEKETVSQIK